MAKLIDEGSYGCVYYPSVPCKGKSNTKIISKIQTDDETSRREFILGSLIEKIPNYFLYFAPVKKKCSIDISTASFNDKKSCSLFKTYKDKKFVNQIMPYVQGGSIREFVTKRKHPKLVSRVLLDGFSHLLKGLNILHKNDICHFDIKLDNILVDEVRNIPIWIDFGLSIQISDLKKNVKKYFFMFNAEYNSWPIEIHLANYLLHENENPSAEDIEKICTTFTNSIKDSLSVEELHKYKKDSIQYLSSLMERKEPIHEIIKHWREWDIYAICFEYLNIFNYLQVKNPLAKQLKILFKQNMHPDPRKIKNIKETLISFEKILDKYGTVENYRSFAQSSSSS
tara:strand:- start:5328 stop:6347 length:1020 start_codon:yes stop_codon:yes gene_type:complete